jgi:predicted CoA-binding protein
MADAAGILRAARSVLVVDWPTREVPEALARGGWAVTVRNGPGPTDFAVFEVGADGVASRPTGVAPAHVDLVYAHRPVAELPGIAAAAQGLGATAIWLQSGRSATGDRDPVGCWLSDEDARTARQVTDAAGLALITSPCIVDVARSLTAEGA